MTAKQRIHLMANLWPAVCAAQSWDPSDRDRRLLTLSEAVGRTITSANEIDARADYDRVIKHLTLLAKPDDFNAAMFSEEADEAATRRRLLWGIRKWPVSYVAAIVYNVTRGVTDDPEQLTTDQLVKLRVTLTERSRAAQRKRRAQEIAEVKR